MLCSPIGAYVIANNQIANYMGFPVNQPAFDYNPNDGGVRHLLMEQNIEPASGTAPPPPSLPNPSLCNAVFNVNRFATGANFPLRRAFGPPLSIQLQGVSNPLLISANFGGWDRYDWRFTWVKARSQVQSKFYFLTNVNDPTYESIAIIPSPMQQPPGTMARWELQATDALASGGQPFGPTTPWLVYWDGPAGDPNNPIAPTGQFFPSILQQLDGFRFIRFRVTMRANHLAPVNSTSFGTFQSYTGVIFNISF